MIIMNAGNRILGAGVKVHTRIASCARRCAVGEDRIVRRAGGRPRLRHIGLRKIHIAAPFHQNTSSRHKFCPPASLSACFILVMGNRLTCLFLLKYKRYHSSCQGMNCRFLHFFAKFICSSSITNDILFFRVQFFI